MHLFKEMLSIPNKRKNGLCVSHANPTRITFTKRESTLSEKQGRNAKERANQNGKAEEQRY